MRHIAVRDTGQVRKSNQDEAASLDLADGTVLLVVADGVGGSPGGDVASAATVEALRVALREGGGADPKGALQAGVEMANARVREIAAADASRSEMASTVVAAIVCGDGAWVAGVGDSRGYVLRGGELHQVTADDSWVAEQVRAGLMTEQEAETSRYKNVITRGIGVHERVDAGEIEWVPLAAGDALLLCSDGLYRMVADDALAEALRAEQGLETTAAELVKMANEAGGADNISLALYRHTGR